MRPQNGKRGRSRGRNKGNHGNLNRTLESNGPDVKIRGSAAHIHEKYLQLARDAHSSGDRVGAENYLQHAEHYHRLMMAALPPGQTLPYNQGQQSHFNGDGQDDGDMDGPETGEALPPQYQPQHANGGNGQGGHYNQHNQNQQREHGEYREQRDQREYRQPRDQGDYRGQRDNRDNRDFRDREPRGDQRDYRDQQPREPREPREQQGEQREPRREFRDQRDNRDQQPREPREPRDQAPREQQPQQARDQGSREAREPREPREPRQDRGEGNDRRLNGRSRRISDDRANGNGRVITTLDTEDRSAPQPASPVPVDDAGTDDTDEALA